METSSRIDKIGKHFFVKVTDIILQARIHGLTTTHRSNNDFNLISGDSYGIRNEVEACFTPQNGSLVIDIFCSVENARKMFDLESHNKVYLERWVIQYESGSTSDHGPSLSLFYKRLIMLIRTIYSSLRLLPMYKAFRMQGGLQFAIMGGNPLLQIDEIFDCPVKNVNYVPVQGAGASIQVSMYFRGNLRIKPVGPARVLFSGCDIIQDYVVQERPRASTSPGLAHVLHARLAQPSPRRMSTPVGIMQAQSSAPVSIPGFSLPHQRTPPFGATPPVSYSENMARRLSTSSGTPGISPFKGEGEREGVRERRRREKEVVDSIHSAQEEEEESLPFAENSLIESGSADTELAIGTFVKQCETAPSLSLFSHVSGGSLKDELEKYRKTAQTFTSSVVEGVNRSNISSPRSFPASSTSGD